MPSAAQDEQRAIAKLIAQIDSIDDWRERVGRRVIYIFLVVFAIALTLLGYVALFDGPRQQQLHHPGPRVPGVLQRSGP